MKKAILLLAPLLMMVGLSANSKKIDPKEETTIVKTISGNIILEGTTVGKYAKPGAPIDMSYKTTKVDTNETADVNITLSTTASNGTMMVAMTFDDKLTIENEVDQNQSFDVSQEAKTFFINLKVSSSENGLYYIRLLTKIDKGYGLKLRSFAVPVYIGDDPKPKVKGNIQIQKASSGENISVSKAVETIKVLPK